MSEAGRSGGKTPKARFRVWRGKRLAAGMENLDKTIVLAKKV